MCFVVSIVPVLHSGNFDHPHFHIELRFVRAFFDPLQYDRVHFFLVLHLDLKQTQFIFTNHEILSRQYPSERVFHRRSRKGRLIAISNWQIVLFQQMLSIVFRCEKKCMALYTMTIESHANSQLNVLSGFRQTFKYDRVHFFLVLHLDLKQSHFIFTNHEILSRQYPSERVFHRRSRKGRLIAISNWQIVLFQQMLSIVFRCEKKCMALYTMTFVSHVNGQLNVLLGFRQTFKYDRVHFFLVLHLDLKQTHFIFTNHKILSRQFPSERVFHRRSRKGRLDAISNLQCVLLQHILSIAFRCEKYCMALYTMTIESHANSQLNVLSGFQKTIE